MGFNAQSGTSAVVRINRSIFVENYASSSHLVCRVRWCVSFMLGVSRLSTQADAAPADLTRVCLIRRMAASCTSAPQPTAPLPSICTRTSSRQTSPRLIKWCVCEATLAVGVHIGSEAGVYPNPLAEQHFEAIERISLSTSPHEQWPTSLLNRHMVESSTLMDTEVGR